MDNTGKRIEGFISPDGTDKIDLAEFRVFRKMSSAEPEERSEPLTERSQSDETDELEGAQLFEAFAKKPEPESEHQEEEQQEPEEPVSSAELLGELAQMESQVSRRKSELRTTTRVVYDPYNESFNGSKHTDYDSVPEMPSSAEYRFDSFKRKK